MGQELLNFRCAELTRVPAFVKRNITPQPVQVSMLCSQGKVPGAHFFPRHREQAGLGLHASMASVRSRQVEPHMRRIWGI